MVLLPLAALALAFSFEFIDGGLAAFGSGLLKSNTFDVLLLFSSSTLAFFVSFGDKGFRLFRLRLNWGSSGRFKYLRSFWLRSSIRYSDTIPWAYRRYDSVSEESDFFTKVADMAPEPTWMFFCLRISATRSVFFFSQERVFSSLYLKALSSSSP